MRKIIVCGALSAFCAMLLFPSVAAAGQYTNFAVSTYLAGNTPMYDNLPALSNDWMRIKSQLKVDKIYIEVQRDRNLVTGETLASAAGNFGGRLGRGFRGGGGGEPRTTFTAHLLPHSYAVYEVIQ